MPTSHAWQRGLHNYERQEFAIAREFWRPNLKRKHAEFRVCNYYSAVAAAAFYILSFAALLSIKIALQDYAACASKFIIYVKGHYGSGEKYVCNYLRWPSLISFEQAIFLCFIQDC
jgi:hypothetical protein